MLTCVRACAYACERVCVNVYMTAETVACMRSTGKASRLHALLTTREKDTNSARHRDCTPCLRQGRRTQTQQGIETARLAYDKGEGHKLSKASRLHALLTTREKDTNSARHRDCTPCLRQGRRTQTQQGIETARLAYDKGEGHKLSKASRLHALLTTREKDTNSARHRDCTQQQGIETARLAYDKGEGHKLSKASRLHALLTTREKDTNSARHRDCTPCLRQGRRTQTQQGIETARLAYDKGEGHKLSKASRLHALLTTREKDTNSARHRDCTPCLRQGRRTQTQQGIETARLAYDKGEGHKLSKASRLHALLTTREKDTNSARHRDCTPCLRQGRRTQTQQGIETARLAYDKGEGHKLSKASRLHALLTTREKDTNSARHRDCTPCLRQGRRTQTQRGHISE